MHRSRDVLLFTFQSQFNNTRSLNVVSYNFTLPSDPPYGLDGDFEEVSHSNPLKDGQLIFILNYAAYNQWIKTSNGLMRQREITTSEPLENIQVFLVPKATLPRVMTPQKYGVGLLLLMHAFFTWQSI